MRLMTHVLCLIGLLLTAGALFPLWKWRRERRARARVDRSVAGSGQCLWQYTPSLDALWCSESFEELFDADLPETLDDWSERVHPDDRPAMAEALRACVSDATPMSGRIRVKTGAGEYRWLSARGQRIDDQVAGSLTDITESVLDSNRLELAVQSAGAGTWDWNLEAGTIVCSDRMFTMLGEQPPQGETPEQFFYERIHPDDVDATRAALERTGHNGGHYEIESRLRRADGTYAWIRSTGTVVDRAPDGSVRHMIGQHIDVTERRAADAELRLSRQRLKILFESLGEGVVVKGAAGTITDCNPAAEEILGLNREQLLGRQCVDPSWHTVNEDGSELSEEDQPCSTTLRTGIPIRGFIMGVHHPDGAIRWLRVNTVPVRGADGAVDSVIASLADITELRLALEHAEAANRSKSEFLANTSHEIRTPMTAILGFVEALEDIEDPQDRAAALETIRRNAKQLLAIINDILDVSKIEAGKLTVEQVETSITQITTDTLTLLRPRAEEKGIGLIVEIDEPMPLILSDPTRLGQIMTNLVSNAIKFTPSGRVVIKATVVGQAIRVEVIDSGIGMTHEQCRHAFDAFRQADSSTTRQFGGTGLGLRICSLLADLLDIELTVDSRPDVGSTFTLLIPLRELDRQAA